MARVLALCRQFEQGDLDEQRAAIEALYELGLEHGEAIAPAVPTLMAALAEADDKLGESAMWALSYAAPASLPGLVVALSHTAALVRERAARALGQVGAQALSAAPALRELLQDAQPEVRRRAAGALGLMHDVAVPTREALCRLVGEGSTTDRGASLHALGNIGRVLDDPQAFEPHRALVIAALSDADADLRRSALYASEALAWQLEAQGRLLCELLARETSPRVTDALLRRLTALAPHVDLSPWGDALIARLTQPRAILRPVCEVLEAMRPPPLQAVPALRALLTHENQALSAASALWRIQPDAELLVPVLQRLIATDDEGVCDLICEMGPAAAPLLPQVLEVLAGEVWDAQWAAADALAAIASSDAEVQRALLQAMKHDSPLVRSGAARGLARQGAVAVPVLRRLVADEGDAWAAYALGLMGEAAAEAMGELRRGLEAGVEPLAGACAIAMARIGSAESVPALIDMLDGERRIPAAQALGALGPGASPAVPALTAAQASPDEAFASAAQAALDEIGQYRQ